MMMFFCPNRICLLVILTLILAYGRNFHFLSSLGFWCPAFIFFSNSSPPPPFSPHTHTHISINACLSRLLVHDNKTSCVVLDQVAEK